MREARTAARLSHANVVAVYDVVVEDGSPWIVMEYVQSASLQQIVAQQGPLDVPTVARIGLGVLAALRAAHGSGVLHRDVKPGNVLIARTRVGWCSATSGWPRSSVTRRSPASGMLIGSPSYMAPERARDGEAGPAADLWSLGATLYYALEGHAPYERGQRHRHPDRARHRGSAAGEARAGAAGAGRSTALLQRSPAARTDAAEVERAAGAALAPHPRGRAPCPPRAARRPAARAGPADLPARSGPPPPTGTGPPARWRAAGAGRR